MLDKEPTTDPFQVYKQCRQCLAVKDVSAFTPRNDSPGGIRAECKQCVNQRHVAWYLSKRNAELATEAFLVEKQCTKCLAVKGVSEFDPGYRACKSCRRDERRAKRLAARPPVIPLPENHKHCIRCLEIKDVSEFSPRKDAPDGLTNTCKKCCNQRSQAIRNLLIGLPRSPQQCPRCLEIKEGIEFWPRCRICKTCSSIRARAAYPAYYAATAERQRAASRTWQKTHPEKSRARSRRSNARRRMYKLNAPYIEDVDVAVLYTRDKGLCGICHKHVRRKDASVDHIIPVSYRGEESYKNTQLAHKRCNSRRGNRNTIPVQMRLLG